MQCVHLAGLVSSLTPHTQSSRHEEHPGFPSEWCFVWELPAGKAEWCWDGRQIPQLHAGMGAVRGATELLARQGHCHGTKQGECKQAAPFVGGWKHTEE